MHNFREARIDVELFGHVTAPDRLLDGTIRRPAASKVVMKAAIEPGYAADQGTKDKVKRYPPARGKSVIGCSIESWGRLGGSLDALFLDLHGLAQRRQRDRGILPTNWLLRWKTLLSIRLAMNTGRAIFDSLSSQDKTFFTCARHILFVLGLVLMRVVVFVQAWVWGFSHVEVTPAT